VGRNAFQKCCGIAKDKKGKLQGFQNQRFH
jgi:hypothetical protein